MSMTKNFQGRFLEWDIGMYHEETDTPCAVKTMALNEELGQISHVFSDKTGTLTCNVMDFRKCSVNGVSYGHGTTEIGIAALLRAGKTVPPEATQELPPEQRRPYVNFVDEALHRAIAGGSGGAGGGKAQQAKISEFFTHLALCHTVIPEHSVDKVTGEPVVNLSASSPDEQALVAGAQFFGWDFVDRAPGKVVLDVHGVRRAYEVLDVLEFNSARKRMSLVARDDRGKLRVYTKGADNVITERLAPGQDKLLATTTEHTDGFAEDGLRTLCIASKPLESGWYEAWSVRYRAACADLGEVEKRKREEPNAIDAAMEEVEAGLTLLGCTAIEDKLQAGVPQAIADLARAGIKMWVLTGDKEETAINIGFACSLLTSSMEQVVINTTTHPALAHIVRKLAEAAALAEPVMCAHVAAGASGVGAKLPEP